MRRGGCSRAAPLARRQRDRHRSGSVVLRPQLLRNRAARRDGALPAPAAGRCKVLRSRGRCPRGWSRRGARPRGRGLLQKRCKEPAGRNWPRRVAALAAPSWRIAPVIPRTAKGRLRWRGLRSHHQGRCPQAQPTQREDLPSSSRHPRSTARRAKPWPVCERAALHPATRSWPRSKYLAPPRQAVFFGQAQPEIEQRRHARVDDSIQDAVALPASGHDPPVGQPLQLVGHRLRRHLNLSR